MEVRSKACHLRRDIRVRTTQPKQRGSGLIDMAVAREPTWTLGQQQHPDGEHETGRGAKPQHPSPRAISGKGVPDEIGDEDADRDGQLAKGDQRAPLAGGCDLGEVEWRQHRGAADPEPYDKATGEQNRQRRCEG